MKAYWNNELIADSDKTLTLEGIYYFPPESVFQEFIVPSSTRTLNPENGEATYYDIIVDGKMNRDAAWSYHKPRSAASHVKDYLGFWRGVIFSDT